MKTFEEFRFKVKHSSISSSKLIEKLKVNDWLYLIDKIDKKTYYHIQLIDVIISDDCYFKWKGDHGSECDLSIPDFRDHLAYDGLAIDCASFIVTTDPTVAEECQIKFKLPKKPIEYPKERYIDLSKLDISNLKDIKSVLK